MADDDFYERIQQQILDAYGFKSADELDTSIEEELPGYLAAEADFKAEQEAYAAQLPGRLEEAAAAVTEWGHAHGILPDGAKLVPIDLQADVQWVAQAQWTQKPSGGATWTEVSMDARPAPSVTEYPRMWAEGQLLAAALKEFGLLDGLIATLTSACESVLTLARAMRLEPWPHGWNKPCFCHPKPFPAARDYRRRTRHRNRRRKS